MKRIFFALVLLLGICVAFSSCQKAPELIITSPSTIELTAEGGRGIITFTANRDWAIKTSDSWVSVSPASGTASDEIITVYVQCIPNETYDNRTASVTITMETFSQVVGVKQAQSDAMIIETTEYIIGPDGGKLEIPIKTNVDFEVVPSVDWIHFTQTKGLDNRSIVLRIDTNDLVYRRDGEVTIKKKGGALSDIVIIRQNVPEIIDLGLSVRWRSCNLGASSPEEYGDYYAWGENETKKEYWWSNYKWYVGDADKPDVIIINTPESYSKYFEDGVTLDPEDDAAHYKLGEKWRMPTAFECRELVENCTWEPYTIKGVQGKMGTSKVNGRRIFLPATGYYGGSTFVYYNLKSYYSSSTLDRAVGSNVAIRLDSEIIKMTVLTRFNGTSIRPVTESNK